MAQAEQQDKQHPASERKLREAREQGQVAKSRDFGTAVALFGVGTTFFLFSQTVIGQAQQYMRSVLGGLERGYDSHVVGFGRTYLYTLAPIFLAAFVLPVVAGLLQTGGAMSAENLGLKWEKLNPIPQLKVLFGSIESALNLVLSMVKVAAMSAVCGVTLWQLLPPLLLSEPWSTARLFESGGRLLGQLVVRAGVVMILLAIADYFVNAFKMARQMRMTTKELQDESKSQDVDPQVKTKRRKRQRQLVQQRSVYSVPDADVVIVNPTHFAVALKYDAALMAAPRVIAKGADVVAERIRAMARKHTVPVVSQPPLARALFRRVDIGRDVPEDLFKAVAVVLAYVYRIKGKVA